MTRAKSSRGKRTRGKETAKRWKVYVERQKMQFETVMKYVKHSKLYVEHTNPELKQQIMRHDTQKKPGRAGVLEVLTASARNTLAMAD